MITIKNLSIKNKETNNYLVSEFDFHVPKGKIYIESEESDKVFELIFASIISLASKIFPHYEITYDELNILNYNSDLAYKINIGNAYAQLSGIYTKVRDEIEFFSKSSNISIFNIQGLLNRDIYTLSGGELQKIILARSYFSKPKLFLLHNQFSELDKKNKELLLRQLNSLDSNLIVYDRLESKYYKYFDYSYKYDKGERCLVPLAKEGRRTSINNSKLISNNSSNKIINIQNLSFAYNKHDKLFDDLSLSFEDGLNFLLGENGAGKSTIFKILTGIIGKKKYNGDVIIKNRKLDDYLKDNLIGISFQNPELSLFNVTVGKELRDLIKENTNLFDKSLSIFKMANTFDKELASLELNEKKKLTLIQALTNNPDILLFDEPTQNFSQKEKREVKEYFELLIKAGKTLIVITHSEDLVKLFKCYSISSL